MVPSLTQYGCYVTESFHIHLDDPNGSIFSQDHIDCADLFFSAARMCIFFDRNGFFDELGKKFLPRGFMERFKGHTFRRSPPLWQADWRQQDRRLIELGRSRAMLESVISGEEKIVPQHKKVFLARYGRSQSPKVTWKKKIRCAKRTSRSQREGRIRSVIDSILKTSFACQFSPLALRALRFANSETQWKATGRLASSAFLSRPPNQSSLLPPSQSPLCPPDTIDTGEEIEAERKRDVRRKWMKWRKHILLYTLAQDIRLSLHTIAIWISLKWSRTYQLPPP